MKALCFIFISILLFTGCSTRQIKAPVRAPYQRDLVRANKVYFVKPGDTLYSIGFRSGHGYRRLATWNKIIAPYRLQIGQKISLFNPKERGRIKNRIRKKYKISIKKRTSSQNRAIKRRTSSQKTSINSIDNKKVLKLTWHWPIKGRILKYFSQTDKKGIDIYGQMGQKIKSAASGKVVYSGDGLKGYGNLLIIKHNYIYLSAYANNSRLLVKEGDIVKKGQIVAEVGRIGRKNTSLHFEIRKNGKPVNPLNYLPKN